MDDDPVMLDAHRGMNAQKATNLRRERREVEKDQAALRQRQVELERLLSTAPASTWKAVATRARYLIELFAATPEAREPRRQRLIAAALKDLAKLAVTPGRPTLQRPHGEPCDRTK
jgi:hypothetical protein